MKKSALLLFAVLSLSVLSLAACGTSTPKTALPGCPDAGVMADAGAAAFFPPGLQQKPGPQDVVVYALLRGLRGDCAGAKDGLEADFSFNIVAQKTPQGGMIGKQDLSYFIAILDKNDTVLQRQKFSVTIDFTKTEAGVETVEHRVKIPPASDAQTDRIVVGFTLTPDQVEFNKAYPHELYGQQPNPKPQPVKDSRH